MASAAGLPSLVKRERERERRAIQQHDSAGQALEVELEARVAARIALNQDVQHSDSAVAGRDGAVGAGRRNAQLQVGLLVAVQARDDDAVDHDLRAGAAL